MDEIGRPGYSRDGVSGAGSMRPAPPRMPREATGAFRIRAAVAVAAAGYAWLWTVGIGAWPMWTTLFAAAWAIRCARISRDPGASDASLAVAGGAAVAGGLYLAYALAAPLYAVLVQHAGVAGLIDFPLTS